MIQVRCPECGYVQTLSEERFLAITSDYINCPHCRGQVPKKWSSTDQESIPDDARHKMLAFTRRILNGGEVSLDMVYALESLVRHYGPMEESAKALGMGYCRLGEAKKAWEFLEEARKVAPEDPEILRSLLQVHLDEEEFEAAVHVGWALLSASPRPDDEDVAALALALTGTGEVEEAKDLLNSRPDLDPRNPVVREALRELDRASGSRTRSLFSLWEPISRVFRRTRPLELRRSVPSGIPEEQGPAAVAESRQAPLAGMRERMGTNPFAAGNGVAVGAPRSVEYWIYSPHDEKPEWNVIREKLSAQEADYESELFTPAALEALVERGELTVAYIRRAEGEELFHYPEEEIPRNSRGMTEQDLETLLAAKMIARVRLVPVRHSGLDYLTFAVRVTEAIRQTTGGIVQDALSHVLWGAAEWETRVVDAAPHQDVVERHVGFDVLEEETGIWIHSHGMQKFGVPEIEMESLPSDLAASSLSLMLMVAETLVEKSQEGLLDYRSPLRIGTTPFLFRIGPRPRDDEGHFPHGSLRIFPYVADYDPESPDTTRHVLKMLMTRFPRPKESRRPPARGTQQSPSGVEAAGDRRAIREKLLEAHRQAISELVVFKKSFQEGARPDDSTHAVKVGFPAQGGKYEWMWVALDAWRGKSLVGRLENTPVLRKDLRKGSRVHIEEGEIFDWVIARGGQVVKGAFTETLS